MNYGTSSSFHTFYWSISRSINVFFLIFSTLLECTTIHCLSEWNSNTFSIKCILACSFWYYNVAHRFFFRFVKVMRCNQLCVHAKTLSKHQAWQFALLAFQLLVGVTCLIFFYIYTASIHRLS